MEQVKSPSCICPKTHGKLFLEVDAVLLFLNLTFCALAIFSTPAKRELNSLNGTFSRRWYCKVLTNTGTTLFYFKIEVLLRWKINRQSLNENLLLVLFERTDLKRPHVLTSIKLTFTFSLLAAAGCRIRILFSLTICTDKMKPTNTIILRAHEQITAITCFYPLLPCPIFSTWLYQENKRIWLGRRLYFLHRIQAIGNRVTRTISTYFSGDYPACIPPIVLSYLVDVRTFRVCLHQKSRVTIFSPHVKSKAEKVNSDREGGRRGFWGPRQLWRCVTSRRLKLSPLNLQLFLKIFWQHFDTWVTWSPT